MRPHWIATITHVYEYVRAVPSYPRRSEQCGCLVEILEIWDLTPLDIIGGVRLTYSMWGRES